MPGTNNPDWTDWRNSQARQMILDDLEVTPLDEEQASAEDAWNIY
jgi:hypothetical protein